MEKFNELDLEYITSENFTKSEEEYLKEFYNSFFVTNFITKKVKMKANRKNLIEHGILDTKLLNLIEFGEEVDYFKRENGQLVQNYGCELSKQELMNAYEDYINDGHLIKTKDYQEISEGIFLIKKWYGRCNYVCYIYKKSTDELLQRILKKIKKYDNKTCIKIGGKFLVINL